MTPKQLLDRLVYAIKHEVNYYSQFNHSEPLINQDYQIVEKALTDYKKQKQILEVLKNKQVDFLELKEDIINCDSDKRALELYNERHRYDEEYNDTQLTEKEYDLLKEWLK